MKLIRFQIVPTEFLKLILGRRCSELETREQGRWFGDGGGLHRLKTSRDCGGQIRNVLIDLVRKPEPAYSISAIDRDWIIARLQKEKELAHALREARHEGGTEIVNPRVSMVSLEQWNDYAV